jgi:hypothetical protein
MAVEHIEVLVEEPSMEAALHCVLPVVLSEGISFAVYPSRGKDALLKKLPERLDAYSRFLPPTWRIVVVVDRDNDDCHELKGSLEESAWRAGLVTKSSAAGEVWHVVNRVAIEELEAWFFGDMDAVRAAYPRVSPRVENQARLRDPDAIRGGTWEALERVLQNAGYFNGGLRKIEAARSIAVHLEPNRNRSKSFQVFRDAIAGLSP